MHGSGPVSVAGDNDAAVTDTESESEYSASSDESSDNESSMDQQRLAEKPDLLVPLSMNFIQSLCA